MNEKPRKTRKKVVAESVEEPIDVLDDYLPELLNEIGQKQWKRLYPLLRAKGLYDPLDENLLLSYCISYETLFDYKQELPFLKKELKDYQSAHPDLSDPNVRQECKYLRDNLSKAHEKINVSMKQIRELSSQLALSPRSRSMMKVATGPTDKNPLLEILAEK